MARDMFGLPSIDDAVFDGCVSGLQRSWAHAAVFIAREYTKRKLGWDCFNRGAPKERGGHISDPLAHKRVKDKFIFEYEKLCLLVRNGEVLTCTANITPYVAKPHEVPVVEKPVIKVPRNIEVGRKALLASKELLSNNKETL